VDGWGFLVICECGVLLSFCGKVQRLMVLDFVIRRGKRTPAWLIYEALIKKRAVSLKNKIG